MHDGDDSVTERYRDLNMPRKSGRVPMSVCVRVRVHVSGEGSVCRLMTGGQSMCQ